MITPSDATKCHEIPEKQSCLLGRKEITKTSSDFAKLQQELLELMESIQVFGQHKTHKTTRGNQQFPERYPDKPSLFNQGTHLFSLTAETFRMLNQYSGQISITASNMTSIVNARRIR